MSDNRKRILEMLAEGKITVDEAERLLSATGEKGIMDNNIATAETKETSIPKYLHVLVEPGPDADPKNADRVNVKVPMSLIKAGMKLTSLIPSQASDKMNEAMKEKGIDFDLKNFKPEDLNELLIALRDLEVDVDGTTKVKVYAE